MFFYTNTWAGGILEDKSSYRFVAPSPEERKVHYFWRRRFAAYIDWSLTWHFDCSLTGNRTAFGTINCFAIELNSAPIIDLIQIYFSALILALVRNCLPILHSFCIAYPYWFCTVYILRWYCIDSALDHWNATEKLRILLTILLLTDIKNCHRTAPGKLLRCLLNWLDTVYRLRELRLLSSALYYIFLYHEHSSNAGDICRLFFCLFSNPSTI